MQQEKLLVYQMELSGSFVNKTYADLAPKLNTGLHDLYKRTYAKVLLATQNPAIAKKQELQHRLHMVGPVRNYKIFYLVLAKI